LVGADHVFDAAIHRAGAVRVKSVTELFAAARLLSSGTRVDGPRLAIVTNGGGPGVMAADRAADLSVPLAQLGKETVDQLSKALPRHWSHADPVDILSDADADRYGAATEIVLADPEVDGVLVLLAPQALSDPDACAEAVIKVAANSTKPLLACWMGKELVKRGRARFDEAGIAHFISPEAGVEAFGYLACYRTNQKALLQAPAPLSRTRAPDVDSARMIIEHALSERRSTLSNVEAKAVLSAFRIPISPSINVTSAAEALVASQTVGLPVAMKINSAEIPHKTDVGGVRLNVREASGVRTAFREIMDNVLQSQPEASIQGVTVERMFSMHHAREVMIGISQDEVFGPVVNFGMGGTTIDIFADSNVALPPLNDFLSRSLIEGTLFSRYLRQFRHLPEVNMNKLLDVLMRISEISCELPEVKKLEINPLLIDDHGVIAADAHIDISSRHTGTARYAHMAIHPYPHELVSHWQLADGTDAIVRPIRPEDALIEQAFVERLSSESKYFRFMQSMEKLTPVMLARFTQIDYDREMALIVVVGEGTEDAHLLGVARYMTNPDRRSCEFALAVSDDVQRQGVGRELMRRLMTLARNRNIEVMEGEVLSNNAKMIALCSRLGFRIVRSAEDTDVVQVRRHLMVV
jgi:acetyltransferase